MKPSVMAACEVCFDSVARGAGCGTSFGVSVIVAWRIDVGEYASVED